MSKQPYFFEIHCDGDDPEIRYSRVWRPRHKEVAAPVGHTETIRRPHTGVLGSPTVQNNTSPFGNPPAAEIDPVTGDPVRPRTITLAAPKVYPFPSDVDAEDRVAGGFPQSATDRIADYGAQAIGELTAQKAIDASAPVPLFATGERDTLAHEAFDTFAGLVGDTHATRALFAAVYGRAVSAKALVEPLCRAIEADVRAAQAADVARRAKEAAAREAARLAAPSQTPLSQWSEGGAFVVITTPEATLAPWLTYTRNKPDATLDDGRQVRAYRVIPGMHETITGAEVRRADDTLSEISHGEQQRIAASIASQEIGDAEFNLRVNLARPITSPAPPWRADTRELAARYLKMYGRHLGRDTWHSLWYAQCVIAGLGIRPDVAHRVTMKWLREESPQAKAFRQRPEFQRLNEPEFLPAGCALELQIAHMLKSAASNPRIAWHALVPPTGAPVATAWEKFVGPIKDFFSSHTEASSADLAAALGVDVDSPDLAAACREAGLAKSRPHREGGRKYVWTWPNS